MFAWRAAAATRCRRAASLLVRASIHTAHTSGVHRCPLIRSECARMVMVAAADDDRIRSIALHAPRSSLLVRHAHLHSSVPRLALRLVRPSSSLPFTRTRTHSHAHDLDRTDSEAVRASSDARHTGRQQGRVSPTALGDANPRRRSWLTAQLQIRDANHSLLRLLSSSDLQHHAFKSTQRHCYLQSAALGRQTE